MRIANQMRRDLEFMQSPGDWPRWPLLPLVHRTLPLEADNPPVLLICKPKSSRLECGNTLRPKPSHFGPHLACCNTFRSA